MAQIIDAPLSFGNALGSGLGAGFSAGLSQKLNELADQKANQLKQNKLVDSFKQLGLNQQQAVAVSSLPEKLQLEFVKQHIQAPQQEAFAQALGQIVNPGQQQFQQPQQQQAAPQPQARQAQPAPQPLTQAQALPNEYKQQVLKYLGSPQGRQQFTPQQIKTVAQSMSKPTPEQLAAIQQELPQQQGKPPVRLTADQAYKLAQLQLDQRKLGAQHTAEQFKYNQEYIKESNNQDKRAHQEDMVLKKIIKLSEKGEVRDATISNILKQVGLDYEGLRNADTAELAKLGNFFLRGGREMFGGKVSNLEMQALLESVPTMMQNKEGRIRVAKGMLIANEAQHKETEIRNQIIDENNGTPPFNLQFEINKRMQPYYDTYSQKFLDNFNQPEYKVAKTFEKLPDASQYAGRRMRAPNGDILISKNGKWVKE